MKIFAISASPRNETTNFVLNKAVEYFNKEDYEVITFFANGKDLKPCMHCDFCLKNKKCVIKDDMLDVYDNLKAADGIIIATPVQSGGISSNLSIIMDRTRALEAIDYNILRGKIGMSIAVGGDRSGGQDFAHLKIISYYMIHGIIPVSGGPFGSNLGASFFSDDKLETVEEDVYGFNSLNRTLVEFEKFLKKYIY